MQKSTLIFHALFVLMAPTLLWAQKKRSATPHALGEDIYKHYSGTIGSKKVMLDLRYGYQGASNYGGSLLYTPDQDDAITIFISEPSSFDHGVPMHATEYRTTKDWTDRTAKHAEWYFVIADKKLTGTWHGAGGRDSAHIDLHEDYVQSYPMDLVLFQEQFPGAEHAALSTNEQGKLVHFMTVLSSSANADQASYINAEMITFMGPANIGTLTQDSWRKYPATDAKKHFRDLTTSNLKGVVVSRLSLLPAYNANGMLVLKRTEGDYGTEVITCLNFDVRDRRKWTLSDILNVDKEQLSALLEAAVRRQYVIDADKKLNTLLNVDKMPITENVMISAKGLYFVYRVGEIASKEKIDDEADLFISYKELRNRLSPDFKKRMEL